MAAVGADRKDVRTAARQKNLVLAEAPDQLAPVGKFGERYSLRQIRACLTRLLLGHPPLPNR